MKTVRNGEETVGERSLWASTRECSQSHKRLLTKAVCLHHWSYTWGELCRKNSAPARPVSRTRPAAPHTAPITLRPHIAGLPSACQDLSSGQMKLSVVTRNPVRE